MTMDIEKTPVSILNEMMVKIKSTIVYELCADDFNSNPPVFTCKVTCAGITTTSMGRSKKEAKQNAAQAMLDKIHEQTFITQQSTCKPYLLLTDVTIMDNATQELQKLCFKHEFEQPVFIDLDATGPPHARNFNVQCAVSTLTEIGTATTKKQAKNKAASKMIKKIEKTFSMNNLLNEELETDKKKNKSEDGETNNNNDLKSTITKTSDESVNLKVNYGFKALSVRKELMENFQDLELTLLPKVKYIQDLVKVCQHGINEKNVKKVKEEFQNMLQSVDIDFHHMLLHTPDPTTYMLIIQLNTIPDILEMSLGTTREEAELRTIGKVIGSLGVLIARNLNKDYSFRT